MAQDKLRNIFQSPFNYENWQSVLVSLFSGVGKNCQLSLESTPQQMPVADDEKMDGFYIGEIRIGMESVKLYTFHIKDDRTNISRNRVGLRNTANYLRDVSDAAIVVYYNDHQWRVSYICDIVSSLKRFSFVFGDQQALYTTPIKRFENLSAGDISLDAILEAFSVEALSKDFFKSYKAQYDKFCSHIGSNSKSNRDYVKKMLGRLVFLQFLQKKGWMNGDYNYMQNLFAQSPYQDDFLEEVLEPLFFHVLNTKEQERNHPKLKNLGDEINIPYLNGGLFEADCNDKKRVVFDAKLFSELFDFFSHYNFTIDENDPNDAEVGIDPEMLGHIFENLLEDNKDKGAFYTPKEIVQYMCRQSLIEYLQSKLGKHTEIESFINNHDTGDRLDGKNYIVANAKAIEELLDNVKICDPAIGSGAFPMGILNEIFHAKMALDMTLDRAAVKKNIIQNSIYGVDIEQGAVDIARLRFWLSLVVDENEPQPLPNLDYKIMQGNSLLESFEGEDLSKLYIETEAADLFSTTTHRKDIIDLQNRYFAVTDHTEKNEIKAEINDIIIKHLSNSINNKQKKLEEQIATTQKTISSFELEIDKPTTVKGKKVEFQKRVESDKRNLTQNEAILSELKDKALKLANTNETNRPYFLWHLFFKDVFDKGGFDIVIGNPPYIQLQANEGTLAEQLKEADYETFARTGDIYCLFYERGLQILRDGGIETFITSNKWMRAGYGEKLRKYLAQNNPLLLLDLGSGVFESATVDTNILIIQKGLNKNEFQGATYSARDFSNVALSSMSINSGDIWTILSPLGQSIKRKIESIGTPLRDWDVEIYRGVLTGYNEAFIIDTAKRDELVAADPRSAEIIKPILRGRDIKRYTAQWAGLWLINTHNGVRGKIERIKIEDYPAIKAHLDEHWASVFKRQDQGDTPYNLRNCAYLEAFGKEKIVWASVGANEYSLIEKDTLLLDTNYFMICENEDRDTIRFLTAVMNSKLFINEIKNRDTELGVGGAYRHYKYNLEVLSIPKLSTNDKQPYIKIVDKILESKKADPKADTTALEAQIDTMVYALYNLTPDEIAIIEK